MKRLLIFMFAIIIMASCKKEDEMNPNHVEYNEESKSGVAIKVYHNNVQLVNSNDCTIRIFREDTFINKDAANGEYNGNQKYGILVDNIKPNGSDFIKVALPVGNYILLVRNDKHNSFIHTAFKVKKITTIEAYFYKEHEIFTRDDWGGTISE